MKTYSFKNGWISCNNKALERFFIDESQVEDLLFCDYESIWHILARKAKGKATMSRQYETIDTETRWAMNIQFWRTEITVIKY